LVFLLQPAQDGDGVLDRGLGNEDRLEAAGQGRVPLPLLWQFLERGGRRARPASFSTCVRYSSSVVAPTQCSSPRASAGFNRFEASMAPSPLPAPTSVCISSMNRMIWPCEDWISESTAFSRSSNSPRYLAPAISAPRSSDSTFLSFRLSGTSPLTMRCARPSTIAVLPTPGSPISTGLFLVRRDSTWMV